LVLALPEVPCVGHDAASRLQVGGSHNLVFISAFLQQICA
jgi:hypothetical protein